MPHGSNRIYDFSFPNVNHRDVPAEGDTDSEKGQADRERFIDEICDGTLIGYKYFDFRDVTKISLRVMTETDGTFEIKTEPGGSPAGEVTVSDTAGVWKDFEADIRIPDGVHALYLIYHGEGTARLLSFETA